MKSTYTSIFRPSMVTALSGEAEETIAAVLTGYAAALTAEL